MLYNSLEKLSKLPGETVVYSGHTEETTIGEEENSIEEAKKVLKEKYKRKNKRMYGIIIED